MIQKYSRRRECDTDDEPGLDAREIATLIQSLGYLPDMSCNLATGGPLALRHSKMMLRDA